MTKKKKKPSSAHLMNSKFVRVAAAANSLARTAPPLSGRSATEIASVASVPFTDNRSPSPAPLVVADLENPGESPSFSGDSVPGSTVTGPLPDTMEPKWTSLSPQTKVDGALDLDQLPTSGIVPIPDPEKISSTPSGMDAIHTAAVSGPTDSSQKPVVNPPASSPMIGTPNPARKWSSIVSDSASLEELGTPTQHVSGAPFVLIPDENLEAAKEEFKEFIFARFHGDAPDMGRVIGVVNAIWARTGPRIFVHKIGQGTFLLRVVIDRTRDIILGRSMWNIAGFPMFVAPWSPDFNPEDLPITSAVVPVELRNVPYLLFNQKILSRLATAVGKPVSLAPETERKENFEVAKLYVRVDLTKTLPDKIVSGFTNGREVIISVTYPWLPVKCEDCGKYGHTQGNCQATSNMANPVFARRKRYESSGPSRGSKPRPGRSRARREKGDKVDQVADKVDQVADKVVQVTEKAAQVPESEDSLGVDPISDDLFSVATISILETMAASIEHPPTIITVNDTVETPMVDSAQILPDIATTSTYNHSSLQKVSTTLVEPDLGSNKFASLTSPDKEEEDPVYLDDDLDSLDLTTPFGKRILRDRPVKLSIKAKEMNWQIVGRGRGRGNRGRGNRGGRG